jgi:hypothetical protein
MAGVEPSDGMAITAEPLDDDEEAVPLGVFSAHTHRPRSLSRASRCPNFETRGERTALFAHSVKSSRASTGGEVRRHRTDEDARLSKPALDFGYFLIMRCVFSRRCDTDSSSGTDKEVLRSQR